MKSPSSSMLPGLCCVCLATTFAAAQTSAPTVSLQQIASPYFRIGAALNEDQVFGRDAPGVKLVQTHFNSITPENLLKWSEVHPEPAQFDFRPGDQFVKFGEDHQMQIIGHTLVWHSQTPGWVFAKDDGSPVSRDQLITFMREHIQAVVGRYRGRIHGWDVVNEAVLDDGQLRPSHWLRIIGEEYLQRAFEYAHEADPDAELYYNDYSMWHPAKRERVIQLVRNLKAKGIRVDGIGVQGHWGLDYPPLDEMEESLKAFARLGVQVMITELDVNVLPTVEHGADVTAGEARRPDLDPYPDGLPPQVQAALTARYSDIFRLLKKHQDKISRVTFWGVHDAQSWRNYWPVQGRTNYPLLFDRSFGPKPCFEAVVQALQADGQ